MRATAHRFQPGHRIRLSVASAYWPVIWPSPFAAEYALHLGEADGSRLVLPVLPADAPRRSVPPFKTTSAGLPEYGAYHEEPPSWRIVEDVLEGSVTGRDPASSGSRSCPTARRRSTAARSSG
jgi:hypothetical protein